MAQQWYVKTKKGAVGPFAPGKLKALASGGKLKPESLIRLDEKEWVVAKTVKGLFPDPGMTMPMPSAILREIKGEAKSDD